jgi:hypothetical protein
VVSEDAGQISALFAESRTCYKYSARSQTFLHSGMCHPTDMPVCDIFLSSKALRTKMETKWSAVPSGHERLEFKGRRTRERAAKRGIIPSDLFEHVNSTFSDVA